jgi:hypothetical protein
MGYCGGYNQPGLTNPTPGFRSGFSFGGAGMGRGWRHHFYATGVPGWVSPTSEQEIANLNTWADQLKTQLDAIQKHIEEIEPK